MPRRVLSSLSPPLLLLLLVGCCPTPVAPVASGSKGVFLRAIPAKGGLPADARAGLTARPDRWPPAILHDDCTSGVREDRELAAALGISLEPVSCPWAEMAPVPVLGAAGAPDADIDAPGPSLGFGVHCYPFGDAVLVLETTERTGDCSHVVGLAIFRKEKP